MNRARDYIKKYSKIQSSTITSGKFYNIILKPYNNVEYGSKTFLANGIISESLDKFSKYDWLTIASIIQ